MGFVVSNPVGWLGKWAEKQIFSQVTCKRCGYSCGQACVICTLNVQKNVIYMWIHFWDLHCHHTMCWSWQMMWHVFGGLHCAMFRWCWNQVFMCFFTATLCFMGSKCIKSWGIMLYFSAAIKMPNRSTSERAVHKHMQSRVTKPRFVCHETSISFESSLQWHCSSQQGQRPFCFCKWHLNWGNVNIHASHLKKLFFRHDGHERSANGTFFWGHWKNGRFHSQF